jgi:uncharacterized protein
MTFTRFALPVLAAGLFIASGALAQTPPAGPGAPAAAPPVPAASPEAHKEAETLTGMIGVNHQADQLIGIMRRQMVGLVMRAGAKPPADDPTKPPVMMAEQDATKIVDSLLMPDFIAQKGDLTNEIIDVWANNFTMDDMKGLIAFYSTPLGKKLIATLPAVTQQGMAAGQAWGQRVYKTTIEKNKDKLISAGLRF